MPVWKWARNERINTAEKSAQDAAKPRGHAHAVFSRHEPDDAVHALAQVQLSESTSEAVREEEEEVGDNEDEEEGNIEVVVDEPEEAEDEEEEEEEDDVDEYDNEAAFGECDCDGSTPKMTTSLLSGSDEPLLLQNVLGRSSSVVSSNCSAMSTEEA